MIRYLSIVVLFFLTGCSAGHYAVRKAGEVKLYLENADAREVLFASSIDGFQLHETKEDGGVWVTDRLRDIEFRYFYFVDDVMFIPDCKYKESDDFGSFNCIYQP